MICELNRLVKEEEEEEKDNDDDNNIGCTVVERM